jgi:hypothetical protein
VTKFYKFLNSRKFTLVTDHLPLKAIFNPEKGIPTMTAARLQRWALILSRFTYNIQNKPSKAIAPADALSRLPLPYINEQEVQTPY